MDLLFDALATYRLTRLVTTDTFPPALAARKKIVTNPATPDWAAELVECPWCASFWIGAGVVVASRVAPKAWKPLARALSFSAVSGLLSQHG